jgi:hypothetical protein
VPKTRTKTKCPVFGTPQELSEIVLPTFESMMKYYLLVKHMLKSNYQNKEPPVTEIAETVVVNIERVWLKSSIPLTSHTRVLQIIRAYHDKYRKLIKPLKGRQNDENLLLSMITDERKYVRELGLRRILKARSQRVTGIRHFTVPGLNYDSSDYIELIDWHCNGITEPPLIVGHSDDVIKELVKIGETSIVDFPRFACHTQAVKRCVKLVTQASATVCGQKSRDGFIRSRLEGRRIMPTFNTKAQYHVA